MTRAQSRKNKITRKNELYLHTIAHYIHHFIYIQWQRVERRMKTKKNIDGGKNKTEHATATKNETARPQQRQQQQQQQSRARTKRRKKVNSPVYTR